MSMLRWIQQDWDGAADHAGQALEIAQRLAQKDSANSDLQGTLATAHRRYAQARVSQGQLDEGQQAYEQAFAIYNTLLEKDPRNAAWRDHLSDLHAELGWIQECLGHWAQALEHHRSNLEISQGLVAEGEKREGWKRDLALTHFDLGRVLLAQGHLQEALPHIDEALKTFRQQADAERPGTLLDCACAMAMMIRACTQQGDHEQVAKLSDAMSTLNWHAESADSPSRVRMLAAIGLEQ
jgi:tetratricopeptide (TPR) repeat protein